MLQLIPAELQALPQWVVAGPDKQPINARTGKAASSTDPSTWSTYSEARATGYAHIGFVLSLSDPYTVIDLDAPQTDQQKARHQKIYDAFESYTELSQSGNGVHITVRGRIPHGVKRDKVEIYSDGRYIIFTGKVLKALPIVDAQAMLDQLYKEMASTSVAALTDQDETRTDEQIYEMGACAANGDKFVQLWEGRWEGVWPSQSEADFALMAMLAFYSQNNEQCRRLFRMSQLGKRDKAQRNQYLNYALKKIRAKQTPPVDLTALLAHQPNGSGHELEQLGAEDNLREESETAVVAQGPHSADDGGDAVLGADAPAQPQYTYPVGLVGELAGYFYDSAIRPVPEIALASAIALCAGIAGRSYNISGTGLNQYLILLARTGSGKEGAAGGINRIVAAVRQQVPVADQFIGPAAFASGQALVRVLDERPCFVSVLGEFGVTLAQLCDPRAPAPVSTLKKVLLDLYAKSGFNDILRGSVYSDTDKNTKMIQAPSITLLGESTPETFYGGLDQSHILEGLIPRFSVIEYNGPRPARNPNAFCPPPQALVDKMATLLTICLNTRQNHTCAPVQLDAGATKLLDEFDTYADSQINGTSSEGERHLWNRAHLKALKLGALVAVGINPQQPIVTYDVALWATQFVNADITNMRNKFSSGEVGSGDTKLEADMRTAVDDYMRMGVKQRRNYKVPDKLLKEPIVPYHYLRRRLRLVASYRNAKQGVNKALETTLNELVKSDALIMIPANQANDTFGVRSAVYAKGATW